MVEKVRRRDRRKREAEPEWCQACALGQYCRGEAELVVVREANKESDLGGVDMDLQVSQVEATRMAQGYVNMGCPKGDEMRNVINGGGFPRSKYFLEQRD